MRKTNFRRWWFFANMKDILNLIQVLLFIITTFQLFILIRQNGHSKEQESAQFMLSFNEQLRGKDGFPILISDIAQGKPIFSAHREIEVDNYLVLWELLDNIYSKSLINSEGLYSAFSYDIQKAYNNKEIRTYIHTIRKEENDSSLFSGFERLAKKFER